MQTYFQGFETLKHNNLSAIDCKNFSENQEVLIIYVCVPVLFRKWYDW